MNERSISRRIVGYDLARAIAILGMVLHHFQMAITGNAELSGWSNVLLKLFDGRPASLFLILAGVGITLYARNAIESSNELRTSQIRMTLVKRGIFLLAIGFLNLVFWPGDILRIYGVSLPIAAVVIDKSKRTLLCLTLFFVVGFGVLLMLLDYEQNWDWTTLTYNRLWTPAGLVRNLFYDGFRSVFPWCGFLFFGMWLARIDLRDRSVNAKCLVIGLSVMLAAEIASAICVSILTGDLKDRSPDAKRVESLNDTTKTSPQSSIHTRSNLDSEVLVLVGTDSMPPLPLFLAASGGFAVFVIALCVRVADKWPQSLIVTSLSATGQLALTWYFVHIYFGLGTLVAFDLIGNQSLGKALSVGCGFFIAAVVLSTYWKRFYSTGPLEGLMRTLTG